LRMAFIASSGGVAKLTSWKADQAQDSLDQS